MQMRMLKLNLRIIHVVDIMLLLRVMEWASTEKAVQRSHTDLNC